VGVGRRDDAAAARRPAAAGLAGAAGNPLAPGG
jgi:hypothetical protein